MSTWQLLLKSNRFSCPPPSSSTQSYKIGKNREENSISDQELASFEQKSKMFSFILFSMIKEVKEQCYHHVYANAILKYNWYYRNVA